MKTKKFTILHSNDMHGDFLAETQGECYQVSKGIQATYNDSTKKLESLMLRGEPISDQQSYKICLQGYHANNSENYLNITPEELCRSGMPKVVSTSAQAVLGEYLRNHQNIGRKIEGRLVYKE